MRLLHSRFHAVSHLEDRWLAAAVAAPGAHSSGGQCAPAQLSLSSLPCPPCSPRHIGIPARQRKDGAPDNAPFVASQQSGTQKLLSWELVYCSRLFRNARVESLRISLHCKIPELPFGSKWCSRPGQGHSGAASPWWGRCCGCYGFPVSHRTCVVLFFNSNVDGKCD